MTILRQEARSLLLASIGPEALIAAEMILEKEMKVVVAKSALADEYQRLAAELAAVLQEELDIVNWVAQCGGTQGPLGQSVIQKFAEMKLGISDRAEAALAKYKALKTEPGGA